jgi:hypothetical protein
LHSCWLLMVACMVPRVWEYCLPTSHS